MSTLGLWLAAAFMIAGFAWIEWWKHRLAQRRAQDVEAASRRMNEHAIEAAERTHAMALDYQERLFEMHREHIRQMREDMDSEPWK